MSFISIIVSTGYSQTVNNVPFNEIEAEYIKIVGTQKLLSNKMRVQIDFGQLNKVFKTKDTQIRDRDDKQLDFNSMVDALNFLNDNGYDFVQTYV